MSNALTRWLHSDVGYSFRQSPTAMLAAAIVSVIGVLVHWQQLSATVHEILGQVGVSSQVLLFGSGGIVLFGAACYLMRSMFLRKLTGLLESGGGSALAQNVGARGLQMANRRRRRRRKESSKPLRREVMRRAPTHTGVFL